MAVKAEKSRPAPEREPCPPRPGTIVVNVVDSNGTPIESASISVYRVPEDMTDRTSECVVVHHHLRMLQTAADGRAEFGGLAAGNYAVVYNHVPDPGHLRVEVKPGCIADVCLEVPVRMREPITTFYSDDCNECPFPREGDLLSARIDVDNWNKIKDEVTFFIPPNATRGPEDELSFQTIVPGKPSQLPYGLHFNYLPGPGAPASGKPAILTKLLGLSPAPRANSAGSGSLNVALARGATAATDDVALWRAILSGTDALSFNVYQRFMNKLFCGEDNLEGLPPFEQKLFGKKNGRVEELAKRRFLPFTDTDAYRAVKVATEAFVMVNCGVLCAEGLFDSDSDYLAKRDLPDFDLQAALNRYFDSGDGMLPYLAVIRAKLPEVPIKDKMFDLPVREANNCYGILRDKLECPCLVELIWSYWHEEGMLVQTTNSIMRRFQNVRSPRIPDPLANLEIDPLRPLNNLMWGYVQDEQHRLSVVRRDCEYEHHYGLHLQGKAVGGVRPADSRSKFLEAFHHLLRLSNVFYKQDDDTTVKADAFPVLNALKEVHLILSEGAHNQFGDLPSTARIEMLMQQWLLARPEFREFLPTRIMVAYPEPWMDRVDAMKKLQGWTDTSVLHFRNLAAFGEQLLLAIRYGNWSDQYDPLSAFNWARFFRPQIQGYIHAYRAATGVDLATETQNTKLDSTPPSVLMKRQLVMQQRRT
jgi:hypothetical protein